MIDPVFFESTPKWRAWLKANHASAEEIMLGLVKVGSGLVGMGYQQALDEALCYGWIDGVRHSIDDKRWMIRFTPRRKGSSWSKVNRKRVAELKREGRIAAPGLQVFKSRDRSKQYENQAKLDAADEERFKADDAAWAYFTALPPSYRHPVIWWVVSAKRPETRERRLSMLIADSAAGRKIKPLRMPDKGQPREDRQLGDPAGGQLRHVSRHRNWE